MPTPRRTSHAEIVAAGRDLLEQGGPTGLTMQAVAARVGVRAPSLYKRVADRDALLQDIARASVEELTGILSAANGDITSLAESYRAFAHAHPESFRLMFSTSAPLDALDRAAAPVLRAMADLVGEDEALDAARLFTAWATGFLQMELAGSFRLGGDVDHAFAYGLRRLTLALTPRPSP
ncbi:MAG: TetR/AcrR family transcriptional regulator [Actinomycetota bacterium]